MVIYAWLSLVLSTLHKRSQELKQSQGSQLGDWVRGCEVHKLAGICCHRLPRWRIDRLPIVLCYLSLLRFIEMAKKKPAVGWSFEMGIGGESDNMLFDFIFRVREGFGIADRCSQLSMPTETFQYTNFYSCHPPGAKKDFIKGEALRLLKTAAWLAQLGERRSAGREVTCSNPRRTNTQGL